MKNFCPKCGSEHGPFINGFCTKCYLEDHKILKIRPKLTMQKCKHCGMVWINHRWVDESSENIKEFIMKKIKISPDLRFPSISIEYKKYEKYADALLAVSGFINNAKVEAQYNCRIFYEFKHCDSCMKRSGAYYEAKMQIRLADKENPKKKTLMASIEELIAHDKEYSASILRKTKMKNGFDMLVVSKRIASLIAKALEKRFKANVKVSTTLAGITKDGKQKLRYTYLVKIP